MLLRVVLLLVVIGEQLVLLTASLRWVMSLHPGLSPMIAVAEIALVLLTVAFSNGHS